MLSDSSPQPHRVAAIAKQILQEEPAPLPQMQVAIAEAALESRLYLIGMLHRLPLDLVLADLVPECDGVVL